MLFSSGSLDWRGICPGREQFDRLSRKIVLYG